MADFLVENCPRSIKKQKGHEIPATAAQSAKLGPHAKKYPKRMKQNQATFFLYTVSCWVGRTGPYPPAWKMQKFEPFRYQDLPLRTGILKLQDRANFSRFSLFQSPNGKSAFSVYRAFPCGAFPFCFAISLILIQGYTSQILI